MLSVNKFLLCYLLVPFAYIQTSAANCNIPEFLAADKVDEYLAVTGQQPCSNDKSMNDKAVYMTDNRFDVYMAEGAIQQAARATAALILKSKLKKEGDYYIANHPPTLKEVGWCASEAFSKQPILASCSAFMVAKDILVTAGHCFRGADGAPIHDYYVVFGYEMQSNQRAKLRFPAKDVYLINKEIEVKKTVVQDSAVVQLNRAVNDRQIFKFKAGEIAKGTKLTLFGYPSGLPLKIANGGKVLENQMSKTVFASNVDAFHGNSGSPVLNSAGLKQNPPRFMVEGILVSGSDDYSKTDLNRQGCARSIPCQAIHINYNRGGRCTSEIITKINRVVAVDKPTPSAQVLENSIINLFLNKQ